MALTTSRRGPCRFVRRPAGFTLVELLVTLVVLMVGIYGMIRVFPQGFSAIEVGQQRTTAAQLAEAEIARWKLYPESLPDAVVATSYDGAIIRGTVINSKESLQSLLVYDEWTAAVGGTRYEVVEADEMPPEVFAGLDFYARPLIYRPLDITPSTFDAAQGELLAIGKREAKLHPNWQPNSLYLPRTVIGERVDIRRLGRTPRGVPFYLLSHAPLDRLRGYTDEEAVYVDVYDAEPWRYVAWTGAGMSFANREFTMDPETGVLYFGPTGETSLEREFKVDYTDPVTLHRVIGKTITVALGETMGSPGLPPGVVPETIQVNQRLRSLPEEQRSLLEVTDETARRDIYYVDRESEISGRIEFPLVLQVDPQPTDIALVKVDYRVLDWGILSFDIVVPENGIVRLPTGAIKGPGYTNPPRQQRPQEVAQGIKHYYNWDGTTQGRAHTDQTTWAYVVAVDRQSGDILTEHEGAEWPPNPHERCKRFLVDYTSGQLDFNYLTEYEAALKGQETGAVYNPAPGVDTPDRSGRTYRIFCRAQSDWAVQLMVTPRRFGRSATGLPGGDPVGFEGGGSPVLLTYAWRPDINRSQVYFPLSEAGQTVAIDYYWMDVDTGELAFVEGEVHSVGQADVRDLGAWACPLAEQLEHTPYEWGPVGVRGISVRARALWVGPGRSPTVQDLSQALATAIAEDNMNIRARSGLSETWHQVVIDSYLTRAPI